MKKTFKVSPGTKTQRRGAVAVLITLLLIPLLAFVAICIDIGWVVTTKTTLQSAADSAAAAGARQLTDNYGAYSSPSQGGRDHAYATSRKHANSQLIIPDKKEAREGLNFAGLFGS